jgi:nicotinamidase-related amidase
MKIKKENTALLIIDMQEKLLPAIENLDELIKNCEILIKGCKILDIPIICTEQYRKGLGETNKIIAEQLSNIKPIEKREFSCIENSEIKSKLETLGKRYIIVAGIEAHICVQQTVLDLMDEDFKPIVIANCISSRKAIDKKFALKRLRDYGADITTYEAILFEMLVTSTAAEFKQISQAII